MELLVSGKYLWVPFKKDAQKIAVHIFAEEKKLHEIKVEFNDEAQYYGYLDMGEYLNKTITLKGDMPKEFCENLKFSDDIPMDDEKSRAKIHFSAQTGWINDPNGLVYHNGVYHLYYQHNPFGVNWENMHWGHATSPNLIDWTHKPQALYPDANGTMFSGCGLVDEKNMLGYGEDTLLFYYTAAGGANEWSKPHEFTQRLAYSVDGGDTLVKSDKFLMETITPENRDPKIFWHEESKAYIMVLFLIDFDFAIFRSTDLINWEKSDTITVDGMWECPDLYELCVDDDENNKMWVFWSADGYYLLGDFDGYKFTAKSERLMAYGTKLPYATQTYANTGDRVIATAWVRSQNKGKRYTGLMALPREMGLVTTSDGVRVRFNPIAEIDDLSISKTDYMELQNNSFNNGENALKISADFGKSSGEFTLDILGETLKLDFAKSEVSFGENKAKFDEDISIDLSVYIDYDIIEIVMNKSTIYMICENDFKCLAGRISYNNKDVAINSLSFEKLRNMKS